ncbi:MAG TPA: lipopolysaccharide biosynthesis protein [Actinomycetes bacterium]|jgi:O-antigen/teichoic acid export membrane protein|nr:lipopolysaccharide biosynthesis protein [Actinomycetes bacterium]
MGAGRRDGSDTTRAGREQASLTAQTASGLRWSYLGSAALVIANLAYTATISRLLDPAAFGLMALANLVVLFSHYFVRMGIASALVQKTAVSDDEIRAASTAGLVFGAACLGVVWLLTPLISDLFRQPALSPVLRVLAISFLPEGWSMTGMGLLRRQLRFRELSMITAGTYVLGFVVVGIGLAVLGAGIWSLVVAALVSNASQAVWQYALLRHPVRPVFRWEPYRAVCGYGMRQSGAHVLDYVGSNLDTFTVGRFATAAVLGQYSRAYYLVFQPLRNYLLQAFTNVLFSSLSRIQSDTARLRRAYLSVLTLGGLVLFPICAGMAVAARELVLVVLGPQWDLAAGIVPWFALAGACSVVARLSQSLADARADLNRSLAVQGAYLAALGAFLAVALGFRSRGAWVFAVAVAAAEVLRHVSYLGLVRRILRLSATQVARSYAPAAFASVGVALAVMMARRALAGNVPALGVFAVEICAGALALALCIRFSPLPGIRRELRLRLTAAGALGAAGGVRWRLAPLLLGPPDPATIAEPRA